MVFVGVGQEGGARDSSGDAAEQEAEKGWFHLGLDRAGRREFRAAPGALRELRPGAGHRSPATATGSGTRPSSGHAAAYGRGDNVT